MKTFDNIILETVNPLLYEYVLLEDLATKVKQLALKMIKARKRAHNQVKWYSSEKGQSERGADSKLRFYNRQAERLDQIMNISSAEDKPDPQQVEDYILSVCGECDSTPSKRYLEFIANQVINGTIELPNDTTRMSETLDAFHRMKDYSEWEFEKDIHKIDDWRSLEEYVHENFATLMSTRKSKAAKSELLLDSGNLDSEFYLNKNAIEHLRKTFGMSWLIAIQEGLDTMPRQEWLLKFKGVDLVLDAEKYQMVKVSSIEGAILCGIGTRWCTTSPGTAETYMKSGPLYNIIKDNRMYAQSDVHFHHLRDNKDQQLRICSVALDYFLGLCQEHLQDESLKGVTHFRKLMKGSYPALSQLKRPPLLNH